MIKPITICADDYGQNVEISQGIIDLVAKQRLSAVSCLTNMPNWPEHGRWLLPYNNTIDIGLHFNLTSGLSLSQSKALTANGHFGTLPRLLLCTHLRRLNRQEIAREFNQQLDKFTDVLGYLPNFIDGHEHVHHLPIISNTLLEVCQQRFKDKSFYIRSVCEKNVFQLLQGSAKFKRCIIYLTGGRRFKQQLLKTNVAHNASFSGIYNFDPLVDYAKLFPTFLANSQANGLIMCHPGLASSDATDPLYRSRQMEHQYLAGDTFLQDCQKFEVRLSRLDPATNVR